ncbi:MarR family winged helix-turn-helix transcriptional regulator [Actinomadura harenae]|uniref:MarR family transcriptional regulator n=1 Tax=Actinomadura harenae TaxID=2483351 RepID=A0A3M2M3T4_9ACTN|nr:MarR family transcriptional regulator [Actinomadura harenae]RMI43473.1 MarR family transcriptional regulator [Actinomadura harenae]
MTDTRWLDEEEQRTWRAFVAFSRLLSEAMERQLGRDEGLPFSYYLILAMLSEAPGRSLTMTELATVVRASPSRLSHAVNKLQANGWVERSRHPEDRRAIIASLTDEGMAVVEKAAPGHVGEVRRLVFDRLTPEQLVSFDDVLTTLLTGLDPDVPVCPDTPVCPTDAEPAVPTVGLCPSDAGLDDGPGAPDCDAA